ncbi:MAG: hypothetical protein H3C30_10265 [Candidatus Hydrogenedentes bacterium]|nr:hypothetical protein [Candidatus Hydrogenedentota bacterium]
MARVFCPFFFRMLAAAALCCALFPAAAGADDLSGQGRAVFGAAKDSVITVKAVISMSFGGEEQVNEQEANATVINSDGLAVLSLSAVDLTSLFAAMEDLPEGVSSKLVSLKMVGQDGSEQEAEVVLRDKDLDLAFIRPTAKPEVPMPNVNLENLAVPGVMDPVVVVGQMGAVAQRAHIAFIERIEGVVEKPRRFYILGEHRSEQVMCSPVFTMEGGFAGIGAMRVTRGGKSMQENVMVIVVPAAQIAELVEQVPARAE